jgi:hypothetical protein
MARRGPSTYRFCDAPQHALLLGLPDGESVIVVINLRREEVVAVSDAFAEQ